MPVTIKELHDWDVTPQEAIRLQNELAPQVNTSDRLLVETVRLVAGVDVSVKDNLSRAAVVVLRFPALDVIETVTADRPTTFPYVPGLLSFREIPALLPLFRELKTHPALVLCDGQGIAHPRRMGLATHLGLVFDLPCLGWAKSRLIGEYREPSLGRGHASELMDRGEQIGWVLRSRERTRPTFVSPGHRVSMEQALGLARMLMGRYRLCEPARQAHALTREVARQFKESRQT